MALGMRWAIVAAALLIMAAAWPLSTFSRTELAPVEDQSHTSLFFEASPDSTLAASNRDHLKVVDVLTSFPETDFTWSLTSAWGGFGGLVAKDWKKRTRSTEEMYGDVFGAVSQVSGLRVFPRLDPPLPTPGQYDVELVLQSDAPVERMLETAKAVLEAGWKSGKFLYVDTDLKIDMPEARVVLDREKIADLGLDLAGVGRELGTLLGGDYVNRFQQRNAVRIFGGVQLGVTKEEGLRVLESAAAAASGPVVGVDYVGESRQIRREGSALTVTLGFAVVLIYLVLAAQFHSFRDPLIVLLGSVPLAISGALIFSFLDLTTINIYSQVGLITLVGLISKNGILIVQFANELQTRGLAKIAALREAALTRLRPVLMTSAATVFGHLPLVLVTGPGAEARNSIGTVLVTGMTVGTLFTLFVGPVFYSLIAARHRPIQVDEEIEQETRPSVGPAASAVPALGTA
ncbi:MAG: efflux RND transporter permease subunit [Terrimicrobiaceae bacterium]